MEPRALGWEVLCDSWLLTLDPILSPFTAELRVLFSWLVAPCLEFLNRHCLSMIPTSDMTLVASLCKLMSAMLDELRIVLVKEAENARRAEDDSGAPPPPKVEPAKVNADGTEVSAPSSSSAAVDDQYVDVPEQRGQWVECMFLFSVVWSLGASTDTEGRAKFSAFFRDLLQGRCPADVLSFDAARFGSRRPRAMFPSAADDARGGGKGEDQKDVYEFMYNRRAGNGNGQWVNFMTTIPNFVIPPESKFNDIIVPTIDTVRTNWLLDLLITQGKHVLLAGQTGTAKSVCATQKLLRGLDRSVYLPFMLAFSARTSANQTQDIIDGKLDRRRTGVLGPPPNKKCVIFVDDLNMPLREVYGAQPPIELLRQWMDYGGWYNTKSNSFTQIVDVQFVAAMGPPGGGRNPVTQRYLRHYNTICLTPYDDSSLKRIFGTITRWWLEPFPAKVRSQMKPLVDATVKAYSVVCSQLLPTPTKSHYTFNCNYTERTRLET